MASMEGVAVGTEVMFFSQYRQKSGGEPYIVTKVGRKLLYAALKSQYERGPGMYRDFPFRIESGVANDGYGHSELRTYEQVEAGNLRERLLKEMKELGLELTPYKPSATDLVTNEALVQILKILRNLKEAH